LNHPELKTPVTTRGGSVAVLSEQYTIFLNTKASDELGARGSSNTKASKARIMMKALPS